MKIIMKITILISKLSKNTGIKKKYYKYYRNINITFILLLKILKVLRV